MHPRFMLLCTCLFLATLVLCACGATPTATPVPPTATPVPPTATPVPPTATPVPPTNTPVPPTATPAPPASPTSSAKAVPVLPNAEWPKLVDVGPYGLYTDCKGSGEPVVMLESGLGQTVSSWVNVVQALKSTTTVCAYNKANLPGSGIVTASRSSVQMIEDLHSLVEAIGIKKPFVLVGHSMGGYDAILYAAKWPTDVAALVLLDSSHPDLSARVSAILPAPAAGEEPGLAKLRRDWDPGTNPTSPEKWDCLKSDVEVRAVTTLGSVPLAVLAAGTKGILSELSMYYGVKTGDWLPTYATLLSDRNKDWLKLSTNSTYAVSTRAGHMIPVDDAPLAGRHDHQDGRAAQEEVEVRNRGGRRAMKLL